MNVFWRDEGEEEEVMLMWDELEDVRWSVVCEMLMMIKSDDKDLNEGWLFVDEVK